MIDSAISVCVAFCTIRAGVVKARQPVYMVCVSLMGMSGVIVMRTCDTGLRCRADDAGTVFGL